METEYENLMNYDRSVAELYMWNLQRAIAEQNGLEQFYRLRSLFDDEKRRGGIFIQTTPNF